MESVQHTPSWGTTVFIPEVGHVAYKDLTIEHLRARHAMFSSRKRKPFDEEAALKQLAEIHKDD